MGAFISTTGTAQIDVRNSVVRDVGKLGTDWSSHNIMMINGPTARVSGVRFETSPGGFSRGAFAVNKATAIVDNCYFENLRQDKGAIVDITQGSVFRLTSSTIISRTEYV